MNWLPFSQLDQLELSEDMRKHLEKWTLRDGSLYFSGGHKLRQANPAAFEVVNDEHSFIARDDAHVFHGWSLLKSVDRNSFDYLGDRYYRDHSLAYFEHETSLKPLTGRDATNFQLLGCGYARDSSFGYFWGRPLKKCTSPMTLRVIKAADDKTMDYAMDEDHVYCESAALKGADVNTWQPRVQGFSIDKNSVFFFADPLAKADVDSWQHLTRCYSRDHKHVYHMHRRLKGADPDSWKLLDDDYSTDGKRVYFCGSIIEEADAKTFQVSPDGLASDRHGAFDRGSRSGDSSPQMR